MPWIKAWHVIFMVTWFAGLFYLPRLFVYHASTTDAAGIERFRIMESRLFAIMTIGAVLTAALRRLAAGIESRPAGDGLAARQARARRCCSSRTTPSPGASCAISPPGGTARSARWYRWFNEVPSLLLIGIVLLAVARPF